MPTEPLTAFLCLGARPISPATMNQTFWKTYKSKVLQTLSGESEEGLTEEVGTIHACCVGQEQGASGVKGTKKGMGQAGGGAHLCGSSQHIQG